MKPYDYLGFHARALEGDDGCPTYSISIEEGIRGALYAIAYINLPNLWTVKVAPRLTARDRREQKEAARYRQFFPHKRVRHVVLDRNQVEQLRNPKPESGLREVTPHPHRAHWRRLPAGYRKARTWVRETFIGDRRFSDAQNIYEVLN